MNKIIIFATFILLAVIMGCSDNMNLTGPDNKNKSQNLNAESIKNNGEGELVWQFDELIVNTNIKALLEKEISYDIILDFPKNYLITFSGMTNADRWTNGYLPIVEISTNNIVELQLSGMRSINRYTQLQLNNVTSSQIKFYIALFEVDGNGQKQPLETNSKPLSDTDNVVFLKLTDLRISTTN